MNKIINLKELFQSSDKCIELEIKSKIESITSKNELIFIDAIDGENYYKGLTIKKSEIFPKPSCDNLILIQKIDYKLDEDFQQRLFIKAQISKESINEKNIISLKKIDLSEGRIKETLQKYLNIKEDLLSNLFIVHSINENEYLLQLFKKKELYTLLKKCEFLEYSLNLKDIIYISDYYLKEKNIKLTQISLIEKLSEEKIFILLQEKEEISKNYFWGKIIEKDQKNKIIRIMNKNKNIFQLEKYKNEVRLGQYFIFSYFNINNDKISLKEDSDDSYYYYSNEELYFSNRIRLNLYSVIQFYFIDFNNDNQNYYKKISINKNIPMEIKTNKIEIVFDLSIYANNKLMPVEINLIKNELNKVSFFVKVLQGLLNKINVFVNYIDESSYYFEYLYIYFKEPKNILDKTKTIKCYEKNYTITEFDNFDSENRIRFNILNIPAQIDCEQYIKKLLGNSFLVCETFKNDEDRNIYGIFNIQDIIISKSLRFPMKNINSYYYIVGSIYDQLKNDKLKDNEAIEFLEKNKTIFLEINDSLFTYCLNIDTEITDSELKTRIGILICYYFKLAMDKKEFRKVVIFRDIQHIIKKIEFIKEQITNSQILRIFSYLLRAKIIYHNETEILLLSKEKDDSAYLLAQNFILQEIDNINEFSKLFQGYLQMDSYVLNNYRIKDYSYSLSIEPIFIVKHHLKSNYEGFFILEEINDDILGWTEPRENITIINENYLFEKYKYKDPSHIKDKNDLKDCAFGISIVLRHEDNSHKKKNLNNNNIASPLYYCEDGEAVRIKLNNSYMKKGEDGIIIESLINKDQNIIISLAKDFIYGELLDYRLFIQKDFSILNKKIKEIKQKKLEQYSTPINDINNDKKQIDNNTSEMRNLQNYNQNELKRLAKNAIRAGILKIGDIFYTLDIIREMVRVAELSNSIHLLDPVFIEINKELNKSENNNYK